MALVPCPECGWNVSMTAAACPQCVCPLQPAAANPQEGAVNTGSSAMAAEPPGNSENLVHRLWRSFEPELQDALSVAYNQAKREGKTRISTRTFFAAVARLRPGPLAQCLDRLPEGALPKPISADVPRESSILKEDPQLSSCVESALSQLGRKTDSRHKMSTADVFLEVAKHGTGASVIHLREQGV